jgi:hypothetical protein
MKIPVFRRKKLQCGLKAFKIMIEIKELTKKYNNTTALNSISFDISAK